MRTATTATRTNWLGHIYQTGRNRQDQLIQFLGMQISLAYTNYYISIYYYYYYCSLWWFVFSENECLLSPTYRRIKAGGRKEGEPNYYLFVENSTCIIFNSK